MHIVKSEHFAAHVNFGRFLWSCWEIMLSSYICTSHFSYVLYSSPILYGSFSDFETL